MMMHAPAAEPLANAKRQYSFEDLNRQRLLYLMEAHDYFAAFRNAAL
jgi:hypothetical protein